MSDPFIGQIMLWALPWCPASFAFCNGKSMPIQQNQALYSLLVLTFGGDGKSVFNLPDLRGRVPLHPGGQYRQGMRAGATDVTLDLDELPQHSHAFMASSKEADAFFMDKDNDDVLAMAAGSPTTSPQPVYTISGNPVPLHSQTCSAAGGGQSHPNIQPSLMLNFCIALQGIYPPRS
jgi:microcystin-dependent protein